jgi:tetratricopeptide (TPR) repeat protein
MSEKLPSDFCPYKGLRPYTEDDRAFFFGRNRDEQIVISNLYAAPLTVFYGASGVGKSSVLLAGAVPLLQREANVSVIVFRNWQDPNFAEQLKLGAREAVSKKAGKSIDTDVSLPLDEFVSEIGGAVRGPLFFIFDQFEEYFLYHPQDTDNEIFEGEFARTVNRPDLDTNFLISLREDSLSKLDRFQGRIPALMQNMLRLEHLDREGAREAITGPLEQHSRLLPGSRSMSIEPGLADEILNDLVGVKVIAEQSAQGRVEDLLKTKTKPPTDIETPLLQLVMTRLWDEERALDSNTLRWQTFEKLGRAENIARTHLDTMMLKLTATERDEAAELLRYLVTPSGSKIAQEPAALASWTEMQESAVHAILTRLSNQDMRILRQVQVPGQSDRYEIFHDVLAQAILNWRRRYTAQKQEERIRREEHERIQHDQIENERRLELERARRLRKVIFGLSLILVIMVAQMVYAFRQRSLASQATRQIGTLQTQINQKKVELEKAQTDISKAQTDLSKARDVADHMRQGQVYSQQRDYEQAIAEFDQVIAIDPNNPNAYNQKGYAYLRSGNYGLAEENLKRSIAIDPDFIWGHYNLALVYWAQSKQSEAVKEVETVLRIRPDFREILINDGQFSKFKKSPDYLKLIESSPRD